ncbi:MAG: hypothetical protein ABR567_03210 [Myxococcales bacterium]
MLLALILAAQLDGALVLDGRSGAGGLGAFLTTAGTHARSFSPGAVGGMLREMVGVDLLDEQPQWSLAKHGARTLVISRKSVGLSAPVTNAARARAALKAWLRAAPNDRAGRVSGKTLFTSSGREAAALLKTVARLKPFRASGPAWLWVKGRPPLKDATFKLDASSTGLVARGLVTPLRDAILAGNAPSGCEGAPPGCLRANFGPSGRELLVLAFAHIGLQPPPEGPSLIARLLGIDVQELSDARSLPRALRVTATAEPPGPPGPAVVGQFDLADVERELARLSPIDAMRGSFVASVYAAHLIYSPLLRNAGPLALTGTPAKNAAEIEIRLPIR